MSRPIFLMMALSAFWLAAFPAPAQTEDAKLTAAFQEYLDGNFRLRPLEATRLGDHRYDALLESPTVPARAAWREFNRATLAGLPKQVDYQRLTRDGQIDFEIFQHSLRLEEWLAKNTQPFEDDPRVYGGYVSDSIYLLLAQSSLPKETNIANAIARMALIPNVLAAARANLKHPCKTDTETAIKQNRGSIAFFEHDLYDFAGPTSQLAALKAATVPVIAALKDYQQFLEKDVLPNANAEWRLGDKKFAQKLDLELDAGMTADQVMADAETEFARVEREMFVVARQLWSHYYAGKVLPPDDAEGRAATVRMVLAAVSREHATPDVLAQEMRDRVANLKKFITANDILRLPDPDRCEVVVMPEFRRGNSTAYMDAAPPLDPTGVGQLAVSPPPKDWDEKKINSYLEEYNNHMLDILAIHEGYPGHAVQLQYGNRNPSLIRRVLGSGAYIEGWAVYTEQTMVDQGYGGGNLALRLNQLKFYLRAVANTILDHKMHCSHMSDQEALDFLIHRCYQSEGEARLKVIRAQQSSVQLSTYFTGRMAHYRLRQQIERELGDKFQLGRYHEAVLDPGPVPVKYLPELVRAKLGIKKS